MCLFKILLNMLTPWLLILMLMTVGIVLVSTVCFSVRSSRHPIVMRLGTFPLWGVEILTPGNYPIYTLILYMLP